jgi:uncharacterized protein YgiM (DUF1202 family)
MRSAARRAWALLALLFGAGAEPALAARGATVDVEGVELREGPGRKFRVVGRVPKGTPVAASNYPTEGFYKVRTSRNEVGWVPADSLILRKTASVEEAAPPSPEEEAEAETSSAMDWAN